MPYHPLVSLPTHTDIPQPILDLLAEMVAYDNVTSGRAESGSEAGSSAGVE